MQDIITVSGLVKKYKDAVVLNEINIKFEKGKIHGIIGRNGSGKTMLMKCICGFVPVTSGTIEVNGKIVGKEVDMPNDIGVIIETPGFLPNYSGFRNLKFLAEIKREIGVEEITKTMLRLGLDPKSKKWVSKYSMGMRQRLGLVQAIMENPEILILDEPMNGLDNKGVADVRELLISLKDEGKTILLASHSKEDIEILCDTACEMEMGSLCAVKSPPSSYESLLRSS